MTDERRGAMLESLQQAYASSVRVQRDLRQEDRLIEDLRLDSLALVEILVLLEVRWDASFLDEPRVAAARTVGDLCQVLDTLVPVP